MNIKRSIAAVVMVIGLTLAPVAHAGTLPPVAAPAQAASASDVVRNFYAQLVDVMRQGDQLGFSGRYKKLEPTIKTAFNLPLMTRFAVGLDWTKATPEEQQALTAAFSDFSVATYANQFKAYDGEVFQVIGEKPATGGLIVETQLKPRESDPVTLNYLMKKDDQGSWRIVDVFLDGAISELATRRSEFTSIVRRDGIPALVNSLGDKAKQMGPS